MRYLIIYDIINNDGTERQGMVMDSFDVDFYATPEGTKPMNDFLGGIADQKLVAKITHDLLMLESFGNRLRAP
jgi:hypothetical protein